ncbi:MAG: FAD-dependent oxidoreductase [Gemmataceae bacterium]|nr:FAD-dependent oxidoreductase [Gemmataceae bacterium]
MTPPASVQCAIVGGGPGGVFLALLLARQGVEVALLEAHHDFDRDFRGDTVHPSTLELLDRVGLAREALALPHARLHEMRITAADGSWQVADFRRLRTRFPFIALIPQARFLELLAGKVRRYPNAHVLMGAPATALLPEGGVEYSLGGEKRALRAPLVVGADGRFSRVRKLAGMELAKTSPPMDVCWLRLPRRESDPHDFSILAGPGKFGVLLDRGADWQVGYVIAKGGYARLKAEGIEAMRAGLLALAPWLADRAHLLTGFDQVTLLSVESGMVPTWHKPGLLLIGDAAHVMTPVGGIGISYAVQDAAAAARIVAAPLREGKLERRHLAEVQRRREWPARLAQGFQRFVQANLIGASLEEKGGSFRLPLMGRVLLGVPLLRDLPGRFIAFGPQRETVPREEWRG